MNDLIKNPGPWSLVGLILALVALNYLFGSGVAGSAISMFITLPIAVLAFFLAVRAAMWFTFLSQKAYVHIIKKDPRALANLLSGLMVAIALVFVAVLQ